MLEVADYLVYLISDQFIKYICKCILWKMTKHINLVWMHAQLVHLEMTSVVDFAVRSSYQS